MCKQKSIALVFLLSLQTLAAERPTVSELINKYAQTQDKLKSFVLKYEDEFTSEKDLRFLRGSTGFYKTTGGYIGELRTDGSRYFVLEKSWETGNLDGITTKELAISNPRYRSFLWDGTNRYEYLRSDEGPEQDRLIISPKGSKNARGEDILETWRGHALFGFFDDTFAKAPYGYKRIDFELRDANNISVQNQTEDINGSKCWVITAQTKTSKYKLWIDPSHGYNIAQAEVSRQWQDSEVHNPDEISLFTYLRNVRFKMTDGVWVPIEGDCGVYRKLIEDGYINEDHHLKITEFILNPDHAALGSFSTDFIRNGTTVIMIGNEATGYKWENGYVVDSKGKLILDCRPKKPAAN
jgi:hypothetical protein